ncbi:hypothetical protein JZ751_028061 [Albula glossodonta]|uniref:Uncharacterized protein n=1 Tax=Albula glossodonta TaxID=121402 RepID=A0A8T2P814_9TELE|nr:hypothetical protein JZ751_028061 [Albula glossodonta]
MGEHCFILQGLISMFQTDVFKQMQLVVCCAQPGGVVSYAGLGRSSVPAISKDGASSLTGKILASVTKAGFEISALQMEKSAQLSLVIPILTVRADSCSLHITTASIQRDTGQNDESDPSLTTGTLHNAQYSSLTQTGSSA